MPRRWPVHSIQHIANHLPGSRQPGLHSWVLFFTKYCRIYRCSFPQKYGNYFMIPLEFYRSKWANGEIHGFSSKNPWDFHGVFQMAQELRWSHRLVGRDPHSKGFRGMVLAVADLKISPVFFGLTSFRDLQSDFWRHLYIYILHILYTYIYILWCVCVLVVLVWILICAL